MNQLFKNLEKNQRKWRFIFFLITGKKDSGPAEKKNCTKGPYNVRKQCNDFYLFPVEILTGY